MSFINNVSHDGTIVVGNSQTPDEFLHPVRLANNGTLEKVPTPVYDQISFGCDAVAADSSGTVTGMCENAFIYQTTATDSSGFVNLFQFDAGTVADVSQNGQVIVGQVGGGAMIRNNSGVTALSGTGQVNAYGVNGDGSMAVGADSSNAQVGWRWTSAGRANLPALAGWVGYSARDISTDGRFIAGSSSNGTQDRVVKWTGTTPADLGPGSAYSISADGNVLVGEDANGSGMIWQSAAAHALKALVASSPDFTANWTLYRATGVSDDGKVVVGNGLNGSRLEGWGIHLP